MSMTSEPLWSLPVQDPQNAVNKPDQHWRDACCCDSPLPGPEVIYHAPNRSLRRGDRAERYNPAI